MCNGNTRRRARPDEAWRVLRPAGDRLAWRWLGLALVLVTAGGAAGGLAPLALKALVDALGAARLVRANVLAFALAYVGALVLQRLFEQAQTYAYGVGEQRVARRLAGQTFDHMLRLPLGDLLDVKGGALAQTLTEGVLGWRLVCTHLVLTLAPVGVQLAVAAAVLSQALGLVSTLVFLLALSVYGLAFGWSALRLAAPMRAVASSQIDTGGLTADALANVEAIKAFTAEGRFAGRYDQALAATERHWRAYLGRRFESGGLVAGLFALLVGVAVAMASGRVETHAMSVGGFVLVCAYLLQLVRPLEMIGFAIRDIGQGWAYLAALFAIRRRATEPAGPSPLESRQPSHGPADLRFEGVSFAFDPARPTLQDVSFHLRPGSLVGVVGPSGAGKSSLLRLALRFYDPAGGRILLDGRPLKDWPLADLRGQIALVSQDTTLFNDTIAANIALAADAADEGAIAKAAAVADLADLIGALPDGLQTRVGERGLKLSGGEKQRVSIARAALKGARLVICDEATAALDPATERAVWRGLAGLSRRASTLVVTHRLATVVRADQILVLDQGRIVERGTHPILMATDGLYARLWRAQATGAAA